MSPWVYALWGAFGGLSVEAVQFYGAIRRTGKWPWEIKGEPRPLALFVSVVIRVGVGFRLALAAVKTGQVSGPLGVFAVGVAAPLLIEQMAKRVPLDAQQSIEPGGNDAS